MDGWASVAERFMIAGRSIASGERRQSASQDQNGAIQPFVGPNRQHSIGPCGPQKWSILYRLRTPQAGLMSDIRHN